MILHTIDGSPNGRKVRAVIAHLDAPVEVNVRPFKDVFAPEFGELNLNRMMPVLENGSFILNEANAIMQYLADISGDELLYPRDSRARADVARWMFWEAIHFNKACSALAFETLAKPNLGLGEPDQGLVARSQADLDRFAPVLEHHLKDKEFIVGYHLTIADYALLTFEKYRGETPFDWSPYPRINAYFDRIAESEAWKKVAAG